MNSYTLGIKAEKIAMAHFLTKGYKILHHRYKYDETEIDLVLKKGNTTIFVEIKYRSNFALDYKGIINPKQLKRIEKALEKYIYNEKEGDFRLDVILITKDTHSNYNLYHYHNITIN